MNRRAHRAAFEAKRQLPDLTEDECRLIDAAWDKAKTDPAEQRRREHALIQEQARMLHIMRGSM